MSGCGTCGVIYEGRVLDSAFMELGRGRVLFVVVDEQRFCLDCWNEAGRPGARRYSDPVEAELQAQRSLERMMKRGGTHRHLARSGKA